MQLRCRYYAAGHTTRGNFSHAGIFPRPFGNSRAWPKTGTSGGMPPRSNRTDGFIKPCIPTRAHKPPSGPGWVHEIKHDGYRLQVRRDGDAVRLFTRRGHDWTELYPAIAGTAARRLRHP